MFRSNVYLQFLTFLTFIAAVLSKALNGVPVETQIAVIIVIYGTCLVFDVSGLLFLHFAIDESFEFFRDRPLIIRIAVFTFKTSPLINCAKLVLITHGRCVP